MPSPFRQYQIAVAASAAILAAGTVIPGLAAERDEDSPEAAEYNLLLAQLGADLNRLREIQSVEAKVAAKRAMIEPYLPHCEATLAAARESGAAVQDEVLATIMIWALDIGAWSLALDLAEHVLRFGLSLPQRIVRTPATLVAEQVAEGALATLAKESDADLEALHRAQSLTAGHDMPDQVRAKLHRAIGQQYARLAAAQASEGESAAGGTRAALVAALEHLRRALELDKNSGVKKQIEQLAARLKKAPAEQPAQ